MNKQELKEILSKEYYIPYNNSFNIKGIRNSSYHENVLSFFSEEDKREKSLKELLYLLFHPEEKESVCYHPSCNKKTHFISNSKGYSQFCSNECYKKFLKIPLYNRISLIDSSKYPILSKEELLSKIPYSSPTGINSAFIKMLGIEKETFSILISLFHYTKFLPNDVFIKERVFCIKNNITSPVLCSVCKKNPVIFGKKEYFKTCSQSCNATATLEQRRKTCIKKYGADNPSKVPKFQKQKEETSLKKFNKTHYSKTEKFKKDYIAQMREKTGNPDITNYTQSEEWKRDRQIQLEAQREDPNYTHHMKNEECVRKMWNTKKRNGTTNTSSKEKSIYEDLLSLYSDVKKEYKDKRRYPFFCDFYIPEIDLFIEYQGYWSHGNEAFNGRNKNHLSKLERMKEKSVDSKHYESAVDTWTKWDPLKRSTAKKNSLNYLEIFEYRGKQNLVKQIERAIGIFELNLPKEILQKEFDYFKTTPPKLKTANNKNKIINNFTTHFFEKEIQLYKSDPIKRRRLIDNRKIYLNKKEWELSDLEILTGFKKSGIHYGYSHFNPLWIKYFIEKYDISSIYDPCGGWGHRILGASNIKYIYNDIDSRSVKSNRAIAEYFAMKEKYFYNKDAESFIPKETYDAVFTCPPYFNKEDYTDKNSSHKKHYVYDSWVNTWWRNVIHNSLSKKPSFIGIVVSSNLVEDLSKPIVNLGYNLIEKSMVGVQYKGYLSKGEKPKEFLLVFKNISTN